MKSENIKYVKERLFRWAEFYSRGNFYGIGFSNCTIEYRLMKEGHVVKNNFQSNCIYVDEDAEEIEKLVKEMSQHDDSMALALRCYYFEKGGLRIKAKNINISHMQLKYYVDMAHQWLAGRLSNNANSKNETTCNVNMKRV